MAAPSNYNIEVESILGGLESALARGQPLEKAMRSFRNAGYKEKNIGEAVKKFEVLHRKVFHELEVAPENQKKEIVGSVAPSNIQPEKSDEEKAEVKKPKSLVTSQTREKLFEQYEREKLEMGLKKPQKRIQGAVPQEEAPRNQIDQDLKSEEAALERTAGESPEAPDRKVKIPKKLKKLQKEINKNSKEQGTSSGSSGSERAPKKQQVVSGYGDDALRASENFKEAINEMVQSLSKINVPQQITPSRGRDGKQKTQVINKISNYGMKPPTPVNKAVTFLLIFLLILLLGVLAAVFFFREELIELFNTFTLEYLLPLL